MENDQRKEKHKMPLSWTKQNITDLMAKEKASGDGRHSEPRWSRAYFFMPGPFPRTMLVVVVIQFCMSHFAFEFSVFIRFLSLLLFIIIFGIPFISLLMTYDNSVGLVGWQVDGWAFCQSDKGCGRRELDNLGQQWNTRLDWI
jgi:hypothetical protein